eukprot:403345531
MEGQSLHQQNQEPTNKQGNLLNQQSSFDPAKHEQQHRARIHNNTHFIKAQNLIFSNISSVDRLIAYSLNQNSQSLARTKHQQVLSLINNFEQPNAQGDALKMKIKFQQIMQGRLQQSAQMQAASEEENEEEEEDFAEYDEEEEDNDEDVPDLIEMEDDDEVQISTVQQQQQEHPRRTDENMDNEWENGSDDWQSANDDEDQEL